MKRFLRLYVFFNKVLKNWLLNLMNKIKYFIKVYV